VSSEILTCVKPEDNKAGSCLDKVKPLVVIPTDRIVGREEMEDIMDGRFG